MKPKQYSREELQYELERRKRFPPCNIDRLEPQPVTVAMLQDELSRMSAGGELEWLDYECQLAEEHYRLSPGVPFVRYVDVTVH